MPRIYKTDELPWFTIDQLGEFSMDFVVENHTIYFSSFEGAYLIEETALLRSTQRRPCYFFLTLTISLASAVRVIPCDDVSTLLCPYWYQITVACPLLSFSRMADYTSICFLSERYVF